MEHLAAALGCAGLEGDAFHPEANVAKMRGGTPLTDEDRWPWLDQLGAAIGAQVRVDGATIASCSALRRIYRERLAAAAQVPVYFAFLDGERGTVAAHIVARQGHYMPASLLESQYATLERPEADERALTLSSFAPVDEMVDAVLAWVGRISSERGSA